jgi:CRISPR-associated exonuclease Cas4
MIPADLQFSAFGLGLTLTLLALAAVLYASTLRKKSGLPSGAVIYSDSGTWFEQAETLFDNQFQLAGKPDYLVEQKDGSIIPVEVKSGKAPQEPHEGHILQLAAYCLLVEKNYGQRPTHGIIQYKDKAFAVDYTQDLEEDLLDVIADMRSDLFRNNVSRSHEDWRRCSRCGLRKDCYERLA